METPPFLQSEKVIESISWFILTKCGEKDELEKDLDNFQTEFRKMIQGPELAWKIKLSHLQFPRT